MSTKVKTLADFVKELNSIADQAFHDIHPFEIMIRSSRESREYASEAVDEFDFEEIEPSFSYSEIVINGYLNKKEIDFEYSTDLIYCTLKNGEIDEKIKTDSYVSVSSYVIKDEGFSLPKRPIDVSRLNPPEGYEFINQNHRDKEYVIDPRKKDDGLYHMVVYLFVKKSLEPIKEGIDTRKEAIVMHSVKKADPSLVSKQRVDFEIQHIYIDPNSDTNEESIIDTQKMHFDFEKSPDGQYKPPYRLVEIPDKSMFQDLSYSSKPSNIVVKPSDDGKVYKIFYCKKFKTHDNKFYINVTFRRYDDRQFIDEIKNIECYERKSINLESSEEHLTRDAQTAANISIKKLFENKFASLYDIAEINRINDENYECLLNDSSEDSISLVERFGHDYKSVFNASGGRSVLKEEIDNFSSLSHIFSKIIVENLNKLRSKHGLKNLSIIDMASIENESLNYAVECYDRSRSFYSKDVISIEESQSIKLCREELFIRDSYQISLSTKIYDIARLFVDKHMKSSNTKETSSVVFDASLSSMIALCFIDSISFSSKEKSAGLSCIVMYFK